MYHIILFILLIVVPAVAIRADRYDALHGYFSSKPETDPMVWVAIVCATVVLIVVMTIYHYIHIKMMKRFHNKMLKQNEKALYRILAHKEDSEKKEK